MTQPTAPDPRDTGAVLTIDLDALSANWRALAEVAAPAECSAVVKADGYGIGLEAAVAALAAAGCTTFFVALPDEGRRARAAAPDAAIYILDGLMPGRAADYVAQDLRPVLGDRGEIEEWAAFCREDGARHKAAIHVDTGMNRLGLRIEDAAMLAAEQHILEAFEVSLVMSHLACADDPDHPMNARQLDRFGTVRALFPDIPASLANSAGILLGPSYHFDLVRPGIALYGGAPRVAGHPNPMNPVVTLMARVLQVRDVPVEESVGYGAAETLFEGGRVAIVALGYADCYHRAAGSRDDHVGARGVIAGVDAPLVGRVSMDLIALDVTNVPPDAVYRGAWVELIGRSILVDEVAGHAGTIGYEILTGLGARFHRRYVGA
ncbi:MAG: alanine racemase [Hyphomicrobiales bacterium]|nr:alanine racemase [Hyphomicrobiales bacterium]